MRVVTSLFLATSLFATTNLVLAQQFAGQKIPNTLAAATGAQIAFFNVKDAKGINGTLINYYSFPGGKNPNAALVKRAVVVISGRGRNAWDYFGFVRGRIAAATALNSEVSEQSVAIFAPHL
jgi:hypothetical protein